MGRGFGALPSSEGDAIPYHRPRCPKGEEERQERLTRARTVFTVMENFVATRIRHEITESDQARLLAHLNMIQSDLEDLSGTMGFGT